MFDKIQISEWKQMNRNELNIGKPLVYGSHLVHVTAETRIYYKLQLI